MDGFIGGVQKGIDQGIPLALKKFDMDLARAKFNTAKNAQERKLELAERQFEEDLGRQAIENKLKMLSTTLPMALQSGDQSALAALSGQMQEMGGIGLPRQQIDTGVLDIARELRSEAGMPTEEGLPEGKFWSPQTPEEKLRAELAIKQQFASNPIEELKAKYQVMAALERLKGSEERKTEKTKAELGEKYGKYGYGDKPTALQKNVPFIAQKLGISEKEAAGILTQSKSKTPEMVYKDFLTAAMRSSYNPEMAKQKADAAFEAYREVSGSFQTRGAPKTGETQRYKSAEAVRDAFKAGKIDKKAAIKILQEQFGYE